MKTLDAMVQGGDWLGIAKAITYAHVGSGLSAELPSDAHCENGGCSDVGAGVLPPSVKGSPRLETPKTFTCQRNGIDGFISAVDAVIDRVESDEPEWGDSDTAAELSAGIQRGCR